MTNDNKVIQMVEKAKELETRYVAIEEADHLIPSELLDEMELCIKEMETCYGKKVPEDLENNFAFYERCLRENLFMNNRIKYLV